MPETLPFKISTLIYLHNSRDEMLLMQRRKHPNYGLWSSVGGKLEMGLGESPFETAIRETREETGFELTESDLHLWGIIAEKNYECRTHWLMFMFHCKKPIETLPPEIEEGHFAFHSREAIATLEVPETDRQALWPLYYKHREGFISLRVDCHPDRPMEFIVEEERGH